MPYLAETLKGNREQLKIALEVIVEYVLIWALYILKPYTGSMRTQDKDRTLKKKTKRWSESKREKNQKDNQNNQQKGMWTTKRVDDLLIKR